MKKLTLSIFLILLIGLGCSGLAKPGSEKHVLDATNAIDGGVSGVVGIIPSYSIMDLSMSYEYKIFKLEANINNLTNQYYFTRRATGYPGPGILPSDGRAFYVTLQVKI